MMANRDERSNETAGRIELICGPMFAGKSTALIQTLSQAANDGAVVVACKPKRDTRYAADRIVTHDGGDFEARELSEPSDVMDCAAGADVVGVDEFHFFEMPMVQACTALADAGKWVICAGVDMDHRGQLFDVVEAIMQRADKIVRLSSTCSVCGAAATLTQRMVESVDRIVVGGAGDYEPRCEKCFCRSTS
ncbi:MAG: thymidine kinase [Phycisphaerae bacterium]|nr:MAG: thymidine kinase [Phycisphaerae bacterium]